MAFNGSGTFVRLYNWANDKAAAIKIRADRMDNEMNGFATGLSTCITKDGQTTVSANLPMSTFKHTGVGDASARDQYASYGQVQDGKTNWIAAGGTANAITAAYSPAIGTLVDGQLFFVRASAANTTTTPTFSPNGETARTIVKNGGAALAVGDIVGAGHELVLRYNLANTRYELLNPRNIDTSVVVTAASTLTSNSVVKGDGARGLSATGVYIDGSNNVGIGTASPSTKLHVAGAFAEIRTDIGTNSNVRKVATTAHQAGNACTFGFGITDGAAVSGLTVVNEFGGTYSNQYLKFETSYGGVGSGERMRIDKAGKVGINNTSPNYQLDVTGDINTSTQYRGKNACSFWVNFNGTGTVAIRDSFNVASITDNGVGDYTVNFTNAFANANYAAFPTADHSGGNNHLASGVSVATHTTTSYRFKVSHPGIAYEDSDDIGVFGFGGN